MQFLLRHGETVWNRQSKAQGREQIPLTLNGFLGSIGVAEILKRTGDDFSKYRVITSPNMRTIQTGHVLLDCFNLMDCEINRECRIDSTQKGGFAGVDKKTLDKEVLERTRRIGYQEFGGESVKDRHNRLKSFWQEVKNEENIIIITHKSCSRMIRNMAKYGDDYNMDLEYSLPGHVHNIIYTRDARQGGEFKEFSDKVILPKIVFDE